MKYLLITVALLLAGFVSHASDTVHVVTHNRQTVVTDPSKGNNPYSRWGVFPSANVPVRKIIMHIKFACPDSMRCADWDYSDRISIKRKGGVNGAMQDYELGRMLTPYGGAFGKDWAFDFEVDVTDFSLLLRDSVEVEYNHSGYEPNKDRGWAITVDFEIIKGKPAIEPTSIQKIYDDNFLYGDSAHSIEEKLAPVSFTANADASFARLRVVQTGHGMNEPDGCAEFCNKWREIWYNEKLIEKRSIWKKCGDNPLYPQAGTWLINRGYWCPGNLMQPDLYDLPLNVTSHTININMQPYLSKKDQANIVISAYLIQYKKPLATNDASIEDIIVPSTKSAYKRVNPSGAHPQIRIKNNGSNVLNSLLIEYGTAGFAKQQYKWVGSLASSQATTIILPGNIDSKNGENNFTVKFLKNNNAKDAYAPDNLLSVPFVAAPVHDSVVVFYLLTNNQPEHNAYSLKNSKGEMIAERKSGSLIAATAYRDTFHLTPGAYQLALTDSAGDGLEFWFNGRGGRGLARLLDGKGQMLKAFESDCGLGWEYNFVVGPQPDATVADQLAIGLYPTRTKDKTTLDYFSNKAEDVVVRLVTDPDGKTVEEHHYTQLKEGIFSYDLSRYPKGRFYLKLMINGTEKFNKRIRLKE